MVKLVALAALIFVPTAALAQAFQPVGDVARRNGRANAGRVVNGRDNAIGGTIGCRARSKETTAMDTPLLAIVIAVPVIAVFFLFVLLPRLRRHEEEQKRK